jgi:hypothetical protein
MSDLLFFQYWTDCTNAVWGGLMSTRAQQLGVSATVVGIVNVCTTSIEFHKMVDAVIFWSNAKWVIR